MPTRRTVLGAASLPLLTIGWARAASAESAAERPRNKAKYYFKIHEVNVGAHGDAAVAQIAREALEKELRSRPEFTEDVGGISGEEGAELLAELKKRGLLGFKASLRLDRLTKNLKDPKPGGRLKQLAVDVKLSVFGTTFPGEKLAFSGDGQTVVEAEVVEARVEEEGLALTKEVIPLAIKQAVNQAVSKLSMPKSAPLNERRRKRKS